MRRLFFFDLDGTLLNSEKQITAKTYDALRAWHEAGHAIAISSGRPLASILSVIGSQGLLPFEPFAVAYNGTQIRDCRTGKDLYRCTLPMEEVRILAGLARREELYIHSYGDDTICTPREGEELAFYTRVVRLPHRVLTDFPEGLPGEPFKMLAIDLKESGKLARFSAAAKAALPGRISCVLSNPWYLEVFSSEAGKGAAVGRLASLLGIDAASTLAAGDAENDVSMIRSAAVGIAMCNGQKGAIDAADRLTESDNDHDGLAPLIMDYI